MNKPILYIFIALTYSLAAMEVALDDTTYTQVLYQDFAQKRAELANAYETATTNVMKESLHRTICRLEDEYMELLEPLDPHIQSLSPYWRHQASKEERKWALLRLILEGRYCQAGLKNISETLLTQETIFILIESLLM